MRKHTCGAKRSEFHANDCLWKFIYRRHIHLNILLTKQCIIIALYRCLWYNVCLFLGQYYYGTKDHIPTLTCTERLRFRIYQQSGRRDVVRLRIGSKAHQLALPVVSRGRRDTRVSLQSPQPQSHRVKSPNACSLAHATQGCITHQLLFVCARQPDPCTTHSSASYEHAHNLYIHARMRTVIAGKRIVH